MDSELKKRGRAKYIWKITIWNLFRFYYGLFFGFFLLGFLVLGGAHDRDKGIEFFSGFVRSPYGWFLILGGIVLIAVSYKKKQDLKNNENNQIESADVCSSDIAELGFFERFQNKCHDILNGLYAIWCFVLLGGFILNAPQRISNTIYNGHHEFYHTVFSLIIFLIVPLAAYKGASILYKIFLGFTTKQDGREVTVVWKILSLVYGVFSAVLLMSFLIITTKISDAPNTGDSFLTNVLIFAVVITIPLALGKAVARLSNIFRSKSSKI